MFITNLRVTHNTAQHDIIDSMVMKEEDLARFYDKLLSIENVEEAVVLQTCNRFEVYVSGGGASKNDELKNIMTDWFGDQIAEHLVVDEYLKTLKHLFRVVSSIDSMIVGENQILTQVKEASSFASTKRYSGRVLGPIFQKAVSVGKKVRTETDISRGKVSISSAAVELANQQMSLDQKKVLIVGTGKMAKLLAEYLQKFNISELVCIGRTQERHQNFCEEYSGRPIDFKSLGEEIKTTDILFSATSCPSILIKKEHVEDGLKNKENGTVLVDIAMPADIESAVADLPGVQYFNIDDLKKLSEENLAARKEEVELAEKVIGEELKFLINKLQRLHMDFYLSQVMQYTEEIRQKELEKAICMLGNSSCDPKVKEVVEGLSRSLISKVMHNFVSEIHSNPDGSMDLRKFVKIFMGNGNELQHPHAAIKGHPPHQGHGG